VISKLLGYLFSIQLKFMPLPIMTSDEDVQKIVDYFKTKATGVTIDEAKPILGKYLDKRKITAYIYWGILKKEGDKFKLDELGRQFSRTTSEGKKNIFLDILKNTRAYHACLEWCFHRKYDEITNVEVATFWHEHHSTEAGDIEETIKDAAVTLFYICEAAGLGKRLMGRRGGSTRFVFDKEALGQYIGESGLSNATPDFQDENKNVNESSSSEEDESSDPPLQPSFKVEPKRQEEIRHKVFISHGANKEIVDQIKTMLDLASLEYEVAVDKEATAIPVPEKVFAAMRTSTSAIICVTADEKLKNEDGTYLINQNVLIEIGAAFVLYDKKVVLVWDKRLDVPSNLQGLYRCEFQGDELSWSTGMKLMKAVAEFKK
jgi:hypothetical protein